MQLQVDVRSPTPHYEQIRAQVTRLVLTGALPAGTRLPPIRQLAGHLGLSNGAVARAYRELEREGTVVTAGKKGTIVADHPTGAPEQDDDVGSPLAAERERALAAAAAEYAATAHRLGCTPEQTRAALDAVLTAELTAGLAR
ncbi:transcriptional regulator, GntR family [Quadrisphaera granulorum]|uniref:GntR family transcriptional regulator n=1 Tax=Quadrisphaera granulorum TaxID=317664 RepID=A0A316ABD8_9ACTN|nr:GntR family transcriptional regulator [Quadrisphaera granulorum]PWJ54164.1 GntR family transcriptional regulator [Quadrisphaera granulorum]SZE96303.1 transcriptional regulator, GntR family [Quadrisphaera granulorum]